MLRLPDPEPVPVVPAPTAVPEPPLAEVADLRQAVARNPLFRSANGSAGTDPAPEPVRIRHSSALPGAADQRARTGTPEPEVRTSRRRRRAVRASAALDGSPEAEPAPRDRPRTAPEEPAAAGRHAECYACPVGTAFSTLRGASPETVDHLMAASRELVAAARSVIEALESNLERRSGGRASRVQRVDLD